MVHLQKKVEMKPLTRVGPGAESQAPGHELVQAVVSRNVHLRNVYMLQDVKVNLEYSFGPRTNVSYNSRSLGEKAQGLCPTSALWMTLGKSFYQRTGRSPNMQSQDNSVCPIYPLGWCKH